MSVIQVFPLPVEGAETKVLADDQEVANYMIDLGDLLETVRASCCSIGHAANALRRKTPLPVRPFYFVLPQCLRQYSLRQYSLYAPEHVSGRHRQHDEHQHPHGTGLVGIDSTTSTSIRMVPACCDF